MADGNRPRTETLRTNRVADSLAATLRKRILRTADEGERALPKQDELVAEFGVSYPSVREALRILEAEGLITVRRGNVGGAVMRRPDAASAAYALGLALEAQKVRLNDLARGLQLFEPMSARLCAQRDDRAEVVVPHLRANIERSRAVLDEEVGFTHEARVFHDLVVVHSGNQTLRLVVRSLVALWTAQEETWAEDLRDRGEYFDRGARQQVIDIHATIADHIEAGDGEAAEAAARGHLVKTQELFLSRFNDHVVDATSARAKRGLHALV